MIPKKFILTLLLLISFSACNKTSKSAPTEKKSEQKKYTFKYDDIVNFRAAYQKMEVTGDTLEVMREYFANASEGMYAWIKRYHHSPERMVNAIRKLPKYYKSLTTIDEKLIEYEDKIVNGLDGIKKLYPSEFVYLPPICYFILSGGGGSVEMTTTMMSVDYYGYNENIDKKEFEKVGGLLPEGSYPLEWTDQVPHVVVHETAHLFQNYIQGEFDYVSIYTNKKKKTMLAYAVREGGADYLTFLGSGLKNERMHLFGNSHEKELWKLFKPLLKEDPDNHDGWFSGRSQNHPEWPWQIGYYMGYKMVEEYYNNAENKDEALRTILSANEEEVSQKIAVEYDRKWSN